MELPNEGLCRRCTEKIEWRKQYRKYKPLKQPKTCNLCHQKTVLAAYHTLCGSCATRTNCCPFCARDWDEIQRTDEEMGFLAEGKEEGEGGEEEQEEEGEEGGGEEKHGGEGKEEEEGEEENEES